MLQGIIALCIPNNVLFLVFYYYPLQVDKYGEAGADLAEAGTLSGNIRPVINVTTDNGFASGDGSVESPLRNRISHELKLISKGRQKKLLTLVARSFRFGNVF